MTGYVVESPCCDQDGTRVGTFRVYVATEARAQEIVSQGADRTYRAMPLAEMPVKARANLERAQG